MRNSSFEYKIHQFQYELLPRQSRLSSRLTSETPLQNPPYFSTKFIIFSKGSISFSIVITCDFVVLDNPLLCTVAVDCTALTVVQFVPSQVAIATHFIWVQQVRVRLCKHPPGRIHVTVRDFPVPRIAKWIAILNTKSSFFIQGRFSIISAFSKIPKWSWDWYCNPQFLPLTWIAMGMIWLSRAAPCKMIHFQYEYHHSLVWNPSIFVCNRWNHQQPLRHLPGGLWLSGLLA